MNKTTLVCIILSSIVSLSNSGNFEDLHKTDFTKTPYWIRIQCDPFHMRMNGERFAPTSVGILVTAEYVLISDYAHHVIRKKCHGEAYFLAGSYKFYREGETFPGQKRKNLYTIDIVIHKKKLFDFSAIHLVKMDKAFNLTNTVNIVNFAPTRDYILRPECRQVHLFHIMDPDSLSRIDIEGLYYVKLNLSTETCRECKDDPSSACYRVIRRKQDTCDGEAGMPVECDGFLVAIKEDNPTTSCRRDKGCTKLIVLEYFYTDIEKETKRKMPFQRSLEKTEKKKQKRTDKSCAENSKKDAHIFLVVTISVLLSLFCNTYNFFSIK